MVSMLATIERDSLQRPDNGTVKALVRRSMIRMAPRRPGQFSHRTFYLTETGRIALALNSGGN